MPIDSDIESVAYETAGSAGNSMPPTPEEETSLKKAVESFNNENTRLEIGMNQDPLTEDEVVAAIKNAIRADSMRLNSPPFDDSAYALIRDTIGPDY